MRTQDCPPLPEDSEQTHARAEGGGMSWHVIALAALCFLCAILWATWEGRSFRLWYWIYRRRFLATPLKFVCKIWLNRKEKNQPSQPQSFNAHALNADYERTHE